MAIDSLALQSQFTGWDWAIVGFYLLATLGIGLYVNRYIVNMADYVVAGRSLKTNLCIATLVSSEMGLVTIMYAAQKGFTGGFASFHIGLVACFSTILVGLTGFLVIPLREMKVMTIPEFYERRFSRGVRVLGGLILAAAGILNMGLFLKAGSLFLAALTGLNDPASIKIIMTAMLVAVLVYTVLGGMVSVVLTDYLQFVLLSVVSLLACAIALRHIGWSSLIETVKEVHGEAGFNPLENAGFGPTYILWMIFAAGLVSCAIWPTAVTRALAAENVKVVKKLYLWSSIGFLIRFLLPQFLGICALAYFWSHESLKEIFFTTSGNIVGNSELTLQATPLLLSQILPPGLIGLFGAGMLAAFMSTHDSYLLCWASVIVQDVINPLRKKPISAKNRVFLARIILCLIGVFLLVWGLWYPLEQDLWDYMAVSGAIYFTGAFALLFLGIYWRKASTFGAYLALLAGTIALLGLEPVRNILGLGNILGKEITSAHIGLGAVTLSLTLMVAGSLLVPDRKGNPGPDKSSHNTERKN